MNSLFPLNVHFPVKAINKILALKYLPFVTTFGWWLQTRTSQSAILWQLWTWSVNEHVCGFYIRKSKRAFDKEFKFFLIFDFGVISYVVCSKIWRHWSFQKKTRTRRNWIYNTRFFPFKFKSTIVLASRVNANLVGKDPKIKKLRRKK